MEKIDENIELLFVENIFYNLGFLSKVVQGHSSNHPKHVIFISPLNGTEENPFAIQHMQTRVMCSTPIANKIANKQCQSSPLCIRAS